MTYLPRQKSRNPALCPLALSMYLKIVLKRHVRTLVVLDKPITDIYDECKLYGWKMASTPILRSAGHLSRSIAGSFAKRNALIGASRGLSSYDPEMKKYYITGEEPKVGKFAKSSNLVTIF